MAGRMETDTTVILSITGWTRSKASDSADGGVSSLKSWLERKAKRTILNYEVQGDVFQIQVQEKDKRSFLHVNGWQWAGTNVTVVEGPASAPPRGPRNQSAPAGPRSQGFNQQPNQNQNSLASRVTGEQNNSFSQNQGRNQSKGDLFDNAPAAPRGRFGRNQNPQLNGSAASNPFNNPRSNSNSGLNGAADATTTLLLNVIRRRYNAAEKFLDFSSLATDPDIIVSGLMSSPAEKVFSAIFVICEQQVFETKDKRADMVESLSFKGNSISSVREIIGASSTFFRVKNLDLSNNNFKDVRDLTWWKNRFSNLEQIILAGNPVDSPQLRDTVRKWFRNLKTYNMQPLDSPFPAVVGLPGTIEQTPPVPTSSPVPNSAGLGPNGQLLNAEPHPEFPPGSTFGLPLPGKPEEQLIKEQLGLKFSYETKLKMKWVEECLAANGFDYDKAMNDLNVAMQNGNVPADAFLQV